MGGIRDKVDNVLGAMYQGIVENLERQAEAEGEVIDCGDVELVVTTLKMPPPETYWNLAYLRSLETYKDFSDWSWQKWQYHESPFSLMLSVDMAFQCGEDDRAEHLLEILAVPYLQRRVECGYYKFTTQQIENAKTIEVIEKVQGSRAISVNFTVTEDI